MTNPQSDSNLQVLEEVREALAAAAPVLALESTIITHGMPFPKNLETALAVQDIVRANGVTPATVAIIEGQLKVGLDSGEIEMLARQGPAVTKCSRRDIPFLLNSGTSGATTVAATMIVAEMAGIRIFATGGIGGVHRGASLQANIRLMLNNAKLGAEIAVAFAGQSQE